MFKVVKRRQLNENMFWLVIEAPLVARKAKPGQFVILITDEYGERIPLTIADANAEEGWIALAFQAVGATSYKLSQKNVLLGMRYMCPQNMNRYKKIIFFMMKHRLCIMFCITLRYFIPIMQKRFAR